MARAVTLKRTALQLMHDLKADATALGASVLAGRTGLRKARREFASTQFPSRGRSAVPIQKGTDVATDEEASASRNRYKSVAGRGKDGFQIASRAYYLRHHSFVGCSSNGNGSTGLQAALPPVQPAGMAKNYISHVIVIIQENRSFENFFAGWPGANAPMTGCASPAPPPSGSVRLTAPTSSEHRLGSNPACPAGDSLVALHQVTFETNSDLAHDWGSSMVDWNKGQMDGFTAFGTKRGAYQAYEYIEHSQIEPYRTMAEQYVLADEMFPTEFGGSFTGHLTLVAGTDDIKLPTEAEVNFASHTPDDCDSPPGTKTSYLTPNREVHFFDGPFPCFDQFNTAAQVLDDAKSRGRFMRPKS